MTREEIGRRLEEHRAALRSIDPYRSVALFAADTEVQDPAGGPVNRGEQEVRAYFTSVMRPWKRLDMTLQASYITPPNGAAVKWSLHAVQQEGPDVTLKGISTYDFREDGKLSRMMVYRPIEPASTRNGRPMTSRQQMLRWLANYWDVLRSMDADRWVDLYTGDASVEDPVGGPVFRGKAELRAFFDGVKRGVHLLDLAPETIILTPPHAAVRFATRVVPRRGAEFQLRGIVTYAFDVSGKVTQMRAYWSL
jgi:steroid delta-isomerase